MTVDMFISGLPVEGFLVNLKKLTHKSPFLQKFIDAVLVITLRSTVLTNYGKSEMYFWGTTN